ncbi:MAG: hypothetical protein ABH824_04790 [Nanoarchaeota archaeon]|nr:hypothetical protein [Nanoarchaeota archaeon]MBU1632584.1 hypothetical protein [Nanoarchaeota archaeon]
MAEKNILEDFLEYKVPENILDFFRKQAEQKIEVEGWLKQGRNVDVKKENFVHCWITEEAFKQILIERKKWFRYRGLYFGDSVGAGADFTVKVSGTEVTLGLRSVAPESLYKWKSVAYPDDRFRDEQNNAQKSKISGTSKQVGGIADFHIVCNHDNGLTKFFGIISKEKLLATLELSKRMYSKMNQEYFRIIDLKKFNFSDMIEVIDKMDEA